MAFRQRPGEKPGEMTARWIARTQRVNEAQGGKDGRRRRRRRINPGRRGGHVSVHFDGCNADGDAHSSSGLFTAPALPGRHVRSHAVRDMRNVRGNIVLEEAALFASLTRTSFGVCCMTQAPTRWSVPFVKRPSVMVMRE